MTVSNAVIRNPMVLGSHALGALLVAEGARSAYPNTARCMQ